ncbi:MAG TPA: endo-1,4-beta-xylanase [Anaerolineae bacterium]|nr:endo-1,4-beta-xylanase [Anaerolineae bacterium]HQH38690.1 endo-1,4-beta-xylanase [Anaerolineae bacterium]
MNNAFVHRMADATVTVCQPDGTALAHQEVTVAQRKHKFLFGNTAWDILALANGVLEGVAKERAERINAAFFDLFNFATLPFYWAGFEPERGKPNTAFLRQGAQYFAERGCTLKGHPLCWHTLTAPWLLEMSNAEILEAQIARIHRDVADFAGLVDMWDVLNEVVIMPVFDKYDNGITRICKELGRIPMVRTMFNAAREANPGAILLLNDFDVSPAFNILVEGCLEAGIKIDVIGIQSHMHQGYWGVEKTQWVLANFERFGLPIHFTETTILSGDIMPAHIVDLNDWQVDEWPSTPEGEARQAEEIVMHYKTLLAHPLVAGITYWGMTDGDWLKAPSGFLTQDGYLKPSYHALHDLIKGEWWLAPTKMTTDGEGKVRVKGFLGEYELTCGGATATFALEKSGATAIETTLPG